MRVNDAGKAPAFSQSPRSFAQEILILRNEYAAEFRRPLQQAIVIKLRRAVFLRRHDID